MIFIRAPYSNAVRYAYPMIHTFASRARLFLLVFPAVLLAVICGLNLALSQNQPAPPAAPNNPAPPTRIRPLITPNPAANIGPPKPAIVTPAPTPNGPVALDPYVPRGLALFMIGQRNSEIEPCGCVKNQLGGIQFEATLYAQVKREWSLRLDVGGWNAPMITPEAAMKSSYALRAMGGDLDLDAVNVGQPDLNLGKGFFENLTQKNPDSTKNLVSANIFLGASPQQPAFAQYKLVERSVPSGQKIRCAVTGVVSNVNLNRPPGLPTQPDPTKDYNVVPPTDALKTLLPELRKQAELVVVMFHGQWAEAVELAKAHQDIDVLVCSSTAMSSNTFVAEGRVMIIGLYSALGKQLGRTELVRNLDGAWKLADAPVWMGVSPKTLLANQKLVDLINDYKKNTAELIIQRPKDPKMVFAGSHTCQACHALEYKTWTESKHAFALQSLITKGSQFDPACLKCHTLGFKTDNGYYNLRETPMMANVQCENCHGPAMEHVKRQNQIMNKYVDKLPEDARKGFMEETKKFVPSPKVEATTCVQCHQGENDPHFNYDAYVPKVNHKAQVVAGK